MANLLLRYSEIMIDKTASYLYQNLNIALGTVFFFKFFYIRAFTRIVPGKNCKTINDVCKDKCLRAECLEWKS